MTSTPEHPPQTARRGALFILVGPGGVGKNTLMDDVMARLMNITQLATATTRAPRPGETEGVQHLFVSQEEFKTMLDRGDLLEHEEVHPGKFYGVPRKPIQDAVAQGRFLIADIECVGAEKVKAAFPDDVILLFIMPTSLDILAERMRTRGESEEGIAKRMARARREMLFKDQCDYVIINDELETAAEQLYHIVLNEQTVRLTDAITQRANN